MRPQKILATIIFFVAFVVFPLVGQEGKKGICTGDNVNVRVDHGDNYNGFKILYQMNKGDEFEILAEDKGWYKINSSKLPSAQKGAQQWVMSKFVEAKTAIRPASETKATPATESKELGQNSKQAESSFSIFDTPEKLAQFWYEAGGGVNFRNHPDETATKIFGKPVSEWKDEDFLALTAAIEKFAKDGEKAKGGNPLVGGDAWQPGDPPRLRFSNAKQAISEMGKAVGDLRQKRDDAQAVVKAKKEEAQKKAQEETAKSEQEARAKKEAEEKAERELAVKQREENERQQDAEKQNREKEAKKQKELDEEKQNSVVALKEVKSSDQIINVGVGAENVSPVVSSTKLPATPTAIVPASTSINNTLQDTRGVGGSTTSIRNDLAEYIRGIGALVVLFFLIGLVFPNKLGFNSRLKLFGVFIVSFSICMWLADSLETPEHRAAREDGERKSTLMREKEEKVAQEKRWGDLKCQIFSTYTPHTAGFDIAPQVYEAAKAAPGLNEVTIEIELIVAGGVVDKYGNTVEGPFIMGKITVGDLAEVRRYKDGFAYANVASDLLGAQINKLRYSYLLKKE